jgi:hypothetical protein
MRRRQFIALFGGAAAAASGTAHARQNRWSASARKAIPTTRRAWPLKDAFDLPAL